MAVTMLGAAGWTVKVLVTRRLHRRLVILQQQHALEKERTRIARDIHDELGALLTEISLISDHGQKRRGQPGEVEIDLRKISDTAREAVQTADASFGRSIHEMIRLIIWPITLSTLPRISFGLHPFDVVWTCRLIYRRFHSRRSIDIICFWQSRNRAIMLCATPVRRKYGSA